MEISRRSINYNSFNVWIRYWLVRLTSPRWKLPCFITKASCKLQYLENMMCFLFFSFFMFSWGVSSSTSNWQQNQTSCLTWFYTTVPLDWIPFCSLLEFSFFKKRHSCMDSHLTDFLTWTPCFCGMSWKKKMFLATSRMIFFHCDIPSPCLSH